MLRVLDSLPLPTWRPRRQAAGLLAVLLFLRLAAGVDAMKIAAPAAGPSLSHYRPALETMYIGELLGESPRPTDAPSLELVRRATDPKTCGFESGFGVYLTCSDGYVCTNVGNFRGCCATAGGDAQCSLNINTACVEYSASLTGACNSTGPQTQCCGTSTKGSCFTWLFTPLSAPGTTLTEWQCRSAGGFGILIDDPGLTSTSSPPITTPASSTSGAAATTTSSSGAPPAPTNTDSSTPVGAIVGGTVGGLAVIGLGAVGVLLILRRKGKHDRGGTSPGGTATGYSQPPGYGPANGGAGGTGYAGAGGYAMQNQQHQQAYPKPHEYYTPSSTSPGQSILSPYTPMVGVAGYPQSAVDDPNKMYHAQQQQQQWGGYDPRMAAQGGYAQVTPPPPMRVGPSAELEGTSAIGSYGNRAELRG